jgi:putative phosphonate transport system ATP-binding protein
VKLKFNLVESIVAGVLAAGLLVLVGLGKIHLESALAFIGGTLILKAYEHWVEEKSLDTRPAFVGRLSKERDLPVLRHDGKITGLHDLAGLSEARQRLLARTDWGFVEQNPRDGLRMAVSAGANVAERLMVLGQAHYGRLRGSAMSWMSRVELDASRVDDRPTQFSGGMQQRLQIARNLVTQPRLVFMDEPTSGLDVSVQARLLDLLRSLVDDLGLSCIVVTHDLAVARLLAHRLLVMKDGAVVEAGLTDRVLDDPQHPYTQLLVSSVLMP